MEGRGVKKASLCLASGWVEEEEVEEVEEEVVEGWRCCLFLWSFLNRSDTICSVWWVFKDWHSHRRVGVKTGFSRVGGRAPPKSTEHGDVVGPSQSGL